MEAASLQRPVYDSARRPVPLVDEARNLWDYRGLLGMLVARDVVLRYKRSLLGVWWTLLNPLVTMAVLWIVFSRLFRFQTGVPYAVYLLSGLVIFTFFQQATLGVGSSILSSAGILSKVHAPPEVFCVAAGVAASVNFVVALVPLLIVVVLSGVAIPITAPLVIVPAAFLLLFAAGIGLLIASLAVRFQDTLELTQVVMLLALYLSPVFYPIGIVDSRVQRLEQFNPLYHFLGLFRDVLYIGTIGPATSYLAIVVSALGALLLGTWVFARSWRGAVVGL